MKVSAIIRGSKDKLGRQTVYIRVNTGEKKKVEATLIRVLPEQFKNGRIVDHPQAKLYNLKIKELIVQKESDHLTGASNYPDADYREYLTRCLRLWNEKSHSTLTQLKTNNEQFLEWNGEIKLSKVTVSKLNDFKAYLNKKYKGSNMVWKIFRNMRTLYSQAHKEKVIRDDPFEIFKYPQYKQTKRNYLTKEQVQIIENYTFTHCPEGLKLYALWFLMGCYTGLRFSDMVQFNKSHIKGGRLILYTMKTGEIVSLPLNSKLTTLLEALNYQQMSASNQNFNENLKTLGSACELPNLTVHVSRHTFAVMCATNGVPIEVTAKLMGQTDTKSTAIYYRITNPKVDAEYAKIFAK